ncbi:MAG: hypothetical protein KJ737_19095 [Proteobacteria bacterium]|nr:hypothetical protein [Pseudomonadota bacterium]
MGDNITFNYNIDLTWSIVKLIRDKVSSLVESQSEELAYACKMTSSELVENAVKYGCSIDNKKGIEFFFSLGDNEAQIKVSNGVINKTDFENVKAHINEINSSVNPQDLYIKRLNTLLEKPELSQSQLGLYRIAFEGEFLLEYSYNENLNILTVTATKKF